MNANTPAGPAGSSPWMNLLRALTAFVLALALTVIVALFGVSVILQFSATPLLAGDSGTVRGTVAVFLLLVTLVPLITFVVALCRRRLAWRGLIVGWVLALGVLVWLAWDDAAVRRPLTMEMLSPVQAGDERSEAVLMQYSKRRPSAEARAFADNKPLQALILGGSIRDAAKWREYVAAHREEVEAVWTAIAPQRRWLDELNRFDRIGDLTPSRFDANIMRFDVWRMLDRSIRAKATLLAMDGKADEAIATLVPMIAVCQRLQQSGRTLVRVMIAVTMERSAIETARWVVENGAVSPAHRSRLAELMKTPDAKQGGRRLLLLEYAMFGPIFDTLKLGDALALQHHTNRAWVTATLNFVSGLFVNRNITINRYGDRIFALAELAAQRELAEVSLQTKQFEESLEHEGGMKNLGGRLLLAASLPNYDKVLETYWQTVDQRAALLARVTSE